MPSSPMPSSSLPPTLPEITPTEADHLVSTGAALLVDVRDQGEYAAGHSPDALWVPLVLLAAGGNLPPAAVGRSLVAVCRGGSRSRLAVDLLGQRGITAVSLAGGMQAWEDEGLPVVTSHGATGQVI